MKIFLEGSYKAGNKEYLLKLLDNSPKEFDYKMSKFMVKKLGIKRKSYNAKILNFEFPKNYLSYKHNRQLFYLGHYTHYLKKPLKLPEVDLIHGHINFFHTKKPWLCSLDIGPFSIIKHQFLAYGFPLPAPKIQSHIFKFTYKKLINNSNCLIVPYTNRAAQEFKEIGVKKNKIKVIPPYCKIPEEIKRRDDTKIRILFIGSDFLLKGGFNLLEAYNSLKNKYDIELQVCTSEEYHRFLNDTDIKIIPKSDLNSLYDIYSQADIFCMLTSIDGYGMVYQEAMAHGLPIIGSDHFAVPEIVEDGKDGYLIKHDDLNALKEKLSFLIEDSNVREQLGRNARRSAESRFAPEVIGKKFKEAYEGLLRR